MAYNKGTDLQNKINKFSQLLLVVKILKFLLFFYSFISFFFWFLNCFEFDWLYLFNWLFIVPYKMVSTFYKPTGLSADFSLAIIGVISLIIGLSFEFIANDFYERIADLQDQYDRYIQQKKRSKPKIPQRTVIGNAQAPNQPTKVQEEEIPALLFLIQSQIFKIKTKEQDMELTIQEVELWRQRVNKSILENVKYSQPLQRGYYRKNLFLIYKDFNYADDFIYYIKPTIESIVMEFRKYGIQVIFNYVLSSISNLNNVEKELDVMDTILALNFTNTFILTNRFKVAYENRPIKKYSMVLKGEYNLSKNLAISNVQPLFVFKNVSS